MKFKTFEEMPVWQDAKELATLVYRLTGSQKLRKDFGLCDQLQRSAVSIMSNISEGYERNSRKEFARFLLIAKGSAGELRSQLHIAHELAYISSDEFTKAHDLVRSVSSQLANFVAYIRAKDNLS